MKEFFEAEVQPSARLTLYVETSRLIVNEILRFVRDILAQRKKHLKGKA